MNNEEISDLEEDFAVFNEGVENKTMQIILESLKDEKDRSK